MSTCLEHISSVRFFNSQYPLRPAGQINQAFTAYITTCICFCFKLIKQILLTKPGGSDVLEEYEEKGTISPGTRIVMVNIVVADMVEREG